MQLLEVLMVLVGQSDLLVLVDLLAISVLVVSF